MTQASIKISNCYVNGVDTIKRANSLRNLFILGGSVVSAQIPILKNISVHFKTGERVGFIGSNGCGKSSLLKVIAGIYPPTSGSVHVSGNISAIIEMGLGLEPELTGRQNIKLLLLYNNMLHLYNKELEQHIIDFSELGSKIDLPLKNYSSGMLSRLAFSATIFQEPDILLLDEVFAAGDSKFVEKSVNFMKNKINSTPITIMVSHSEQIIKENCNRCLLLKNGEIVLDGSPEETFTLYNNGNY